MLERQPMSEAMYYILLALRHPVHGYGIMQRVRELSGGRLVLGPGTLYGILTRMQGEGLIVLEGINGRRKVYTLTETGQEALLAEYRRLKQMVEDSSVLEEDV